MTNVWATWLVLGSSLACNDLIGADEPQVAETPDDVDAKFDGGVGGLPEAPPVVPPGCGDGAIQSDEECDDGNEVSGDGCGGCVVECGMAPELKLDLNHHCYLILGAPSRPMSFDDARAACEEWGGDLASVETADELAMIQQRITHSSWMGAQLVAGEWTWVDGATWNVELEVWGPSEPQEGPACARFSAETLALEARPCAELVGYVCERFPGGGAP